MMLLRTLHGAVVAAWLAGFMLSSSCRAAGRDDGASTSGTTGEGAMMNQLSDLSAGRISRIRNEWQMHPGSHPDPHVPMYQGFPLYSGPVTVAKVERALKIYHHVGILPPRSTRMIKISYNPLDRDRVELSQNVLGWSDNMAAIRILQADPRLHKPFKQYRGWQLGPHPAPYLLESLPHAQGQPILHPGHDTEIHMLSAFHQSPNRFWLVRRDGRISNVGAGRSLSVLEPTRAQQRIVTNTMEEYNADAGKFGSALASVVHGPPILPNTAWTPTRTRAITEASPFILALGERQAIIDLLQRTGKFKFRASDGRQYRVRIQNPAAAPSEPFRIAVEKSTDSLRSSMAQGYRRLRIG